MGTASKDVELLETLVTSSLALLNQFIASLSSTSAAPITDSITNPPNPLKVASDSAKLVKAHTTKLSLLAINKPFTPSAIAKVLKELASTCLPAMMSAAQICEQEKEIWSDLMSRELQSRVRRVFREMTVLLEEVQAIATGDTISKKRDSLSSTGVVWESCDALIDLEKLGIGGLVVQKAEQYRDTIKDAIEELREWAEGEDPESEGHDDALLDSDDEGVDGDRDSIEDIFNAANSMPKDRPELRALVEEADRKLKKVVILYNAVLKRRLKTFKTSERSDEDMSAVSKLDILMVHLRRIPHQVDEMAGCFYDLDEARSKEALAKCVDEALSASKVVEMGWDGKENEFTAWLGTWSGAVG